MPTDRGFYEWGRLVPHTLARLAGLDTESGYRWTAPVLKGLERRLDGVLEPTNPRAPLLFVEFQGYQDPELLLRWLQSIVTFLAQSPYERPVCALVIYLAGSHEMNAQLDFAWEGQSVLLFRPRTVVLGHLQPGDLLKTPDVGLVPLLPLTAVSPAELSRQAPDWAQQIEDAGLTSQARDGLLAVLAGFIKHRLPTLKLEDIARLLGGKKMEETLLGQMLIERGIEQGIERGIEQGIEQGKLQEARAFLSRIASKKFGTNPDWFHSWAQKQSTPQVLEQALDWTLEASTEAELKQRIQQLPIDVS